MSDKLCFKMQIVAIVMAERAYFETYKCSGGLSRFGGEINC